MESMTGCRSRDIKAVRSRQEENNVSIIVSDYLSGIYQSGAAGFPFGFRVAQYVSGIFGSGFLCRNCFHDRAAGTIVSSLQCDRLTRKMGTGKVTAFSVLLTAAALFGFSISHSFAELCLWAVPYGLGAGCVDASLNNYVALHYASRHMSWLHCMWGVGASVGPYIMGFALFHGQGWNMGYRYISFLQLILTAVLFFSLPLWPKSAAGGEDKAEERTVQGEVLTLPQIIRIPGAKRNYDYFFSVIVPWSRQPAFGPAVIWYCIKDFLRKLPRILPVCFLSELQWDEGCPGS